MRRHCLSLWLRPWQSMSSSSNSGPGDKLRLRTHLYMHPHRPQGSNSNSSRRSSNKPTVPRSCMGVHSQSPSPRLCTLQHRKHHQPTTAHHHSSNLTSNSHNSSSSSPLVLTDWATAMAGAAAAALQSAAVSGGPTRSSCLTLQCRRLPERLAAAAVRGVAGQEAWGLPCEPWERSGTPAASGVLGASSPWTWMVVEAA